MQLVSFLLRLPHVLAKTSVAFGPKLSTPTQRGGRSGNPALPI